MATMLEDDFDNFMDTPMERQMKQAERAVYTHPNGWQYAASAAITDINQRLQLQWGHGPLNRAEMNEIGTVIQKRIANRAQPVWDESWTKFIVDNVIRRDGARPTSVTAEVVTGNDALKQSMDEVDAAISQANEDYQEDLDAVNDDNAEG